MPKYLPILRQDILDNLSNSLIKVLLSEGKATSCSECVVCMKNAILLTGSYEELKEKFLVPINEKCTPEIEFFEVRHGGNGEYYTTYDAARQRAEDLQEYYQDVEVVGCSFIE